MKKMYSAFRPTEFNFGPLFGATAEGLLLHDTNEVTRLPAGPIPSHKSDTSLFC